jgi:hypothetical protein
VFEFFPPGGNPPNLPKNLTEHPKPEPVRST